MTSPLVPPFYIEPPVAPAQSYGLFNVAMGPIDMPDPHAIVGIQYVPDWCTDSRLYPTVCDSTPPVKVFDPMDPATFPFGMRVYSSLICGAQTFNFEEMSRRVRARLTAKEQFGVESALWGANGGDTEGFFQAATVNTLADATSIPKGVSDLEQALADCYAQQGILHVRPRTAAYLADRNQCYKEGGRLYTYRGNLISIGDGYSGLGPAGEAPTATTDWMYITGRVIIWRSPDVIVPDPRQTLDRAVNQYNLIAERDYAVVVECCITALEVTLA